MTVVELLAKQAAEQRELSRDRGVAATEMQPDVEGAGVRLVEIRERERELRRQLDEIHREERKASDEYDQLAAAMAAHEAEAQQAADIAESLDRIAKQMRDARPEPPHEALERTGLMAEPPKVVEPEARTCPACESPNPRLHPAVSGGGEVTHICGDPFHESDADDSPFTAVPADPGTVARVIDALPVTAPPAPGEPDPGVTMPDLGPARPPLDPPPGHGVHTHAKPADGLMSRLTGGWPVVGRKRTDEQDGDA